MTGAGDSPDDMEEWMRGVNKDAALSGRRGNPSANALVYAIISRSTNQALGAGTATAISFDTELTDPGNLFTGANPTRLTALRAGWYEANVQSYSSNTTGTGLVTLQKNGATQVPAAWDRRPGAAGIGIPLAITAPVLLAANDYLEVIITLSVAGSVVGDLASGQGITFSLRYIGSA